MSRFANPVSQEEMEVDGVVPDNTKCNNEWAANNFTVARMRNCYASGYEIET